MIWQAMSINSAASAARTSNAITLISRYRNSCSASWIVIRAAAAVSGPSGPNSRSSRPQPSVGRARRWAAGEHQLLDQVADRSGARGARGQPDPTEAERVIDREGALPGHVAIVPICATAGTSSVPVGTANDWLSISASGWPSDSPPHRSGDDLRGDARPVACGRRRHRAARDHPRRGQKHRRLAADQNPEVGRGRLRLSDIGAQHRGACRRHWSRHGSLLLAQLTVSAPRFMSAVLPTKEITAPLPFMIMIPASFTAMVAPEALCSVIPPRPHRPRPHQPRRVGASARRRSRCRSSAASAG